jgi:hypothetical protein
MRSIRPAEVFGPSIISPFTAQQRRAFGGFTDAGTLKSRLVLSASSSPIALNSTITHQAEIPAEYHNIMSAVHIFPVEDLESQAVTVS